MRIIYSHCRDCGRPLKDMKSRERGYGPVCYEIRQKQAARSVIMKLPLDVRAIAEKRLTGKI